MTTPSVGMYANLMSYSDVWPYQVVRVSESGKTFWVASVESTRDPEWKPEFVSGGFAGHCYNNQEQRWIYGLTDTQNTIPVRWSKKMNGWKSKFGRHAISDRPVRFYDYNF